MPVVLLTVLLTEAERLYIDLQKSGPLYCSIQAKLSFAVWDTPWGACWPPTQPASQSVLSLCISSQPCTLTTLVVAPLLQFTTADVVGSKLLASLHAGQEWEQQAQVGAVGEVELPSALLPPHTCCRLTCTEAAGRRGGAATAGIAVATHAPPAVACSCCLLLLPTPAACSCCLLLLPAPAAYCLLLLPAPAANPAGR